MGIFSGEYDCTIDAKGRLLLPSKVKMRLPESHNDQVFLLRSTDPCLLLYALPEWEKVAEKIMSLNEFDDSTASIQRNFMRGGLELELDNLGRILVPKRMLEYANISKDAVLVGLGNRLELWEPGRYEKSLIQDPKELAHLLKETLGTKSAGHV